MRLIRNYLFCLIACGVTLSGLVSALWDIVRWTWTWTWRELAIFGASFAIIATHVSEQGRSDVYSLRGVVGIHPLPSTTW